MKTGPRNENLKQLIVELKRESHKQKSGLWNSVASNLEKSTRNRRVVNLSRLNRHTKENELVVVPGKVLGSGEINHPLTVAAFQFSQSAKEMIEKSKGKCLTIQEMLKQNPQGKKIKILG